MRDKLPNVLELHGTVTQDGGGAWQTAPSAAAESQKQTGFRSVQIIAKAHVMQVKAWAFRMRSIRESKQKALDPFHVLNCGGQEALLAHVLNAEHASKAQAIVFFGLRKGALDCFFAPGINPRSVSGSSCISSAAISGTSRTSCVSLVMIDG